MFLKKRGFLYFKLKKNSAKFTDTIAAYIGQGAKCLGEEGFRQEGAPQNNYAVGLASTESVSYICIFIK